MRVLVTEQVSEDSRGREDLDALLAGAGHEVLRCRSHGDHGFACNPFASSQGCPLEGKGVDVVLSLRSVPGPETRGEEGVLCALAQHVPLVLAGATDQAPWSDMVTLVAKEDEPLIEALQRAVSKPLRRHSEVASVALGQSMTTAGLSVADSSAVAHRVASRIRVGLRPSRPLGQRATRGGGEGCCGGAGRGRRRAGRGCGDGRMSRLRGGHLGLGQ